MAFWDSFKRRICDANNEIKKGENEQDIFNWSRPNWWNSRTLNWNKRIS